MEHLNFPILFKDKNEGSAYCSFSSFNYLRLSTKDTFKFINEYHSVEKLAFDPLADFKYQPDKFEVLLINDFQKTVKQFFFDLTSKLSNPKSSPIFFLEKRDWFDETTYYCYFSETHRLSIDIMNIPAVCETEDGLEVATKYERSCFESIGGEHISKQMQIHSKKCLKISAQEFISAFAKYQRFICDKIDGFGESSFPQISRKIPDNDY